MQRVDARGERAGYFIERSLVGRERAARAGEPQQRPELPTGGGGERLRPVGGGAFHERLRGVAEGDRVGAVGLLGDRDVGQFGELVEQLIAAVEQIVGRLAGLLRRA